jgi:hypothetical protein
MLERYFYFLSEREDMGLLVMDQTQKDNDRRLVRRMENYFTQTLVGQHRAGWVVPSPFFVDSEMAYGVQIADLVIYCLNWGYRFGEMTGPVRREIESFVWLLEPLIWKATRTRAEKSFRTHSVCYVPDPYTPRQAQK